MGLALVIQVGSATQGAAQQAPYFRHFTPAHGLADREVNQVVEDTEGFLWVATNDGLNRFDGREWVTFRRTTDGTPGISGNRITALACAPDGSLWVGTADGGLCQWLPQRMRFVHHPLRAGSTGGASILAVHVERDGTVLASAEKQGVFRKAPGDGGFQRDNGFTVGVLDRILGFIGTPRGTFAACMGAGLVRHGDAGGVPVSGGFVAYPSPGQVIGPMLCDTQGVIWMGAWDNGFYRFDPRTHRVDQVATLEHAPFTASGEEITAIAPAERGFWLGTKGSGLYHYDTLARVFERHAHRFIDRASIASNRIRCLFADSRGAVWVGTDNGLDVIDPQACHFRAQWLNGSIGQADLGDRVTGITAGPQGLVVTSVNGLWHEEGGMLMPWRTTGTATGAHFHTVGATAGGTMLVGTDRSLHLLGPDGRSGPLRGVHVAGSERAGVADPFALPSSRVVAVAESHMLGHPVWIASVYGHGILVVNRRTRVGLMEPVGMPAGPYENMFHGFLVDGRGRLWLMGRNTGLSEGLDCLQADRAERVLGDGATCTGVCVEEHYLELRVQRNWAGPEAPRIITGMVELPDGTFFLATEDRGLLHFDPARERPFSGTRGPHNKLEGIARDVQGRIWCVAAGGFDVFDPQRDSWLRIDPADGLPEKGVQGAIHVLAMNDLAVGSFGSIVRFDPLSVQFPSSAPRVRLTHFNLFGREADSLLTTGAIHLHHTQNFLSIAFTSFAFGSADKHRYHWQLIGVDPGPVDGGTRTEATYTNLKGGDLRFRVWAVNSAGMVSAPAELVLTIAPPYWERWWFLTMLALAIGGVFYAAYRFRIAQLQRMQQLRLSAEIEAQEKERKRIARDLHDDLGTRISTLKLYLGGLHGYLVPGEEARAVERNAVEILDASVKDLRNMLNDLSPDTVSRYGYVRAVEELARHITNSRVIEADVAVAGSPPRMEGTRELALYRITQELFNNSIKHSGCTHIHVRILHDQGRMEVLYEDNGKGMTVPGDNGGHGVRNITNRLQLIGGTITWDSAPGRGLRAIINLPS